VKLKRTLPADFFPQCGFEGDPPRAQPACATCGEPIRDYATAVMRRVDSAHGPSYATGPHHAACVAWLDLRKAAS
jgi:hypothetical protein